MRGFWRMPGYGGVDTLQRHGHSVKPLIIFRDDRRISGFPALNTAGKTISIISW